MAMDIRFKQVGFAYQAGTPFEMRALHDVSFSVKDGSYVAIIGHTGSGKSTILQHLNALLKPTEGLVELGDKTIDSTIGNKDLKPLRKKVGIVFQFPEAQLFEETVEKDIAFGPKNFGVSEEEALKIAAEVVKTVGLPEEVLKKSPFDLSGGQMRRVAIAGVLAMKPEVLVLDEPTAGLDPKGRLEMMEMFYKLNKEQNMTIVLVTHQMNDVSDYADHVIVIEAGNVVKEGSPKEVFSDASWLLEKQLGVPTTLAFVEKLKEKGWSTDKMPLTLDELAEAILEEREVNK